MSDTRVADLGSIGVAASGNAALNYKHLEINNTESIADAMLITVNKDLPLIRISKKLAPGQNAQSIKLGRLTNKKGLLAKSFIRVGNGLESVPGACLWDGEIETQFIRDLSELPAIIDTLGPNQGLTLGYAPAAVNKKIGICTKNNRRPGAIPRDQENIIANDGEQVLLLDYDDGKRSFDELRALTFKAVPEIADIEMFCIESSSAGVRLAEAVEAASNKHGSHSYIRITKGADMSLFREFLEWRFWQHGFGEIKLTKRGAMLERCLYDLSVFDPSRIVFEARPEVGDGLVLVPRKSAYYPGKALDVQSLPKPTEIETFLVAELKKAAKLEKEPEAEILRETYRKEKYTELKSKGIPDRVAWNSSRNLQSHEIHATDNVRVLVCVS